VQNSNRPRRLSVVLGLCALTIAAAGALACDGGNQSGAAAATAVERFEFTRIQSNLFRIDTSTGQVWIVPISGDGGWSPFGAVPQRAGSADMPGRYALNSMGGRRGRSDGPPPQLLRTDRETGRAWMAEPIRGGQWLLVGDPQGNAPTPAPTVAEVPPTARPTSTPTPVPATQSGTPELKVIPRDVLGKTPEQTSKDLEIIVKALNKEGMPVEI